MNLKYGVVELRAMEPEDSSFLLQLMNRPDIEEKVVGRSFPLSLHNEETWIKNFTNSYECIRWTVVLNGNLFGTIILSDINWIDRSAEIGIKVNITDSNRIPGDAKDAYYAVLHYAFYQLNLNRITAAVLCYNTPSCKLQTYFEFKQEGCLRSAIYKNGKYHDLLLFGLLKSDFVPYEDGSAPWQKNR